MKKIIIILLLTNCIQYIEAQDTSIVFYEKITNDSAILFFNERFRLVSKDCANYKRYTKLDNRGDFNGSFADFSLDSILIGKGFYNHGIKHGFFEIYYSDGNKQCHGTYENGRPIGEWQFYYPNGIKERTIKIENGELRLTQMLSEKGKVMIENSNGEFKGNVQLNSNKGDNILAKGKIINGRPDGKWTAKFTKEDIIFCKEEFENGKFIKGEFPNSLDDKPYKKLSYIDHFFIDNYCSTLEYFIREHCSEQPKYAKDKSQDFTFNINTFNSDLGRRLSKVIEYDIQRGNTYDYAPGDNFITIRFKINNEGRPYDLTTTSGWGPQFNSGIKSSLESYTKFKPTTNYMYFHLKVHFNGGFTYSYSFNISANSNP